MTDIPDIETTTIDNKTLVVLTIMEYPVKPVSCKGKYFKIFDDRIEFLNQGKLPDGLTVEQLISGKYSSSIRYKQIASVFKEAGIIEKYGPEIKRVLEAFQGYGLAQPIFEEIQNGFKVAVSKTTQKTRTRNKILEILHTNPSMTREELASVLGKSPNTIKEHIAKLKADGRLERIGSNRDGYWRVLNDKSHKT
ncbi:MAG: winged helix-turn-helix transcriptional regulator [Desulfobacteraceae bacterium]|nr:winged helix-turn-helix transcriptional regulator [Desulfobacteraceae bacterium]MBC2720686.1 winged helix-turn-helix transcriptional regulator [Desulfobacteraceae bacterium]